MTVQTEVAVIGAGPAGLSAALAAAELGVEVYLIDSYSRPGGQYFKQLPVEFSATTSTAHQHAAAALLARLDQPNLKVLSDTLVWGIYEDNLLTLAGPQAPARLQARAVILATGAYDRPVAFPGWTLPGVMTAGAAQTMLKQQRLLPGQCIVLAGTGPLQLAVAAGLVWAGAEVVAVLEGNPYLFKAGLSRVWSLWGQGARLAEGFTYARTLWQTGVPYRRGWGLVRAEGTPAGGVTGAVIAKLDSAWRPIPGREQRVACDTICVGYGFAPATELSRLAGAEHSYRPELGGWIPVRDQFLQTSVPHLYAIGDGAGIGGARLAQAEGRLAGLAAAYCISDDRLTDSQLVERLRPELKQVAREQKFQQLYGYLFTPGPGLAELVDDETVICRCEMVKLADVKAAIALGADSVSAVKGLTRTGMGDCQGRMCGPVVAAQVARLTGQDPAAVGTYTVRPPIHPLPLELLAHAAK